MAERMTHSSDGNQTRHLTHRCFGLMDSRGRWRAWRFGLADMEEQFITEARQAEYILFASVQTFAAPVGTKENLHWQRGRQRDTPVTTLYFC